MTVVVVVVVVVVIVVVYVAVQMLRKGGGGRVKGGDNKGLCTAVYSLSLHRPIFPSSQAPMNSSSPSQPSFKLVNCLSYLM